MYTAYCIPSLRCLSAPVCHNSCCLAQLNGPTEDTNICTLWSDFPPEMIKHHRSFPPKMLFFSPRKRLMSSQIWYDLIWFSICGGIGPWQPRSYRPKRRAPRAPGCTWSRWIRRYGMIWDKYMDELWFAKLDHDDHDSSWFMITHRSRSPLITLWWTNIAMENHHF